MKYFDAAGNPVIKISMCAFIDVLGFSDKMRFSFNNGTAEELFGRFYAATLKEVKKLNAESKDSLLHVKVFTDNIVLGFPFFTCDCESEFGSIVLTLINYQLAMALEGFFIRGGLTKGPLFMDENTVYGTALLDSHHLESKIARDPRIVLSEEVVDMVKKHTEYYALPQSSPQNLHVLVDSDGQAFINYLSGLLIEDDQFDINWSGLEIHRNNVITAMEEHKAEPSVWAKYLWLAHYHNYFCDLVSKYSGFQVDFKVPASLAERYPERLIPVLHN